MHNAPAAQALNLLHRFDAPAAHALHLLHQHCALAANALYLVDTPLNALKLLKYDRASRSLAKTGL